MTQNLFEIEAVFGKCSEISSPGVRQPIGLKGPRINSGASGFMSKVSNWLGPPNNIKKMTDFAFAGMLLEVAISPSARSSSVRLRPNRPAPPASRTCRLVHP